ncbi:heavy-metal-associated domain-containing protein [Aureisphaera galaxeae]|uniref:heavy-metal-associated domain-containing protein n=1 Tax=Aureisphaera galaxeae TaxID=1538023 RepID=UPI00235100E8|nr:heavy-metal-associated domain-containing protein [Aureisphaera galaxeae]MDC8003059.1 heavy-metal-associated domain-containing protein [Aureisphaera galaxeae]
MKKIIAIVLVLMTTGLMAQDKNAKASLDVDGVCMMCKKRIELASLKTKGVKSAVWNLETHELKLIFDERKTDLKAIQENIAAVGHDTQEIKATDEAYNTVHECCRYRDEKIRDDHEDGDGGR